MPGAEHGAIAAAAARSHRIGRRIGRAGGGHLPCHARIHQPPAAERRVKRIALVLAASALFACDAPRLFYSRAFPGSKPDYIQVVLEKNGDGVYQEAVEDDLPLKFKLTDDETQVVFGLADKLDHFKHPLESPLKVAFMGTKTFRFVDGDQKSEAKFNYSEDVLAQQLQYWFERMAESAEHRIDLERAAKYDHLGVDGALQGLERNLNWQLRLCFGG